MWVDAGTGRLCSRQRPMFIHLIDDDNGNFLKNYWRLKNLFSVSIDQVNWYLILQGINVATYFTAEKIIAFTVSKAIRFLRVSG